MSRKSTIRFCAVIIVIAMFSIFAFTGASFIGIKSVDQIRTGIDIRGGISTTLVPDVQDHMRIDASQLESAVEIITQRLGGRGIFDMNIAPDNQNNRILVEIPYAPGQDTNPQRVIDELGQTAYLTFQEVDEDKYDGYRDTFGMQKNYLPTGNVVIEGTEIRNATVGSLEGRAVVNLEMSPEGAVKFADATSRLIGKKIAIFLDDILITAPVVNSVISDGRAYIEGNFDAREAASLAATIRSGALPFRLVPMEINSITPTLGERALRVTIQAGLLAFILVILFMGIMYRLTGLMANIALVGLVAILMTLIATAGITLTLPGIAGIILTIGMGVDANVIINERIKEELQAGRSLRSAINTGFKRALSTILDSNVTTLITAGVLYVMGTGLIKGFAVTLAWGVIISFLSAVFASQILIKSISETPFAKKKSLYGMKEVQE